MSFENTQNEEADLEALYLEIGVATDEFRNDEAMALIDRLPEGEKKPIELLKLAVITTHKEMWRVFKEFLVFSKQKQSI